MNICVILAAAGASSRMAVGKSKVLLDLLGKPVLQYSLDMFAADDAVVQIVVAAALADIEEINQICAGYAKVCLVCGGASRSESVYNALQAVSVRATHIAVHDAARPLLHAEDWQALKQAAQPLDGAILATAPVDSIKRVHKLSESPQLRIAESLVRDELVLAQTPQLFTASILRRAYSAPELRAGLLAPTDDAELVGRAGGQLAVLYAQHENFKLTFAYDLPLAEMILANRIVEEER